MTIFRYLRGAALFAIICLFGAGIAAPTDQMTHTLWIVAILGILELSLSLDNAVINAKVLEGMTRKWQRRFLTWGILIAVFGMRLILPLIFVSVIAHIGPASALLLAINDEHRYAEIMRSAHAEISAFGGAFLLLVFLQFFLDSEKEDHWFRPVERLCAACANVLKKMSDIPVEFALVCLAALTVAAVTLFLPRIEQLSFLIAGLCGVATWIAVQCMSNMLGVEKIGTTVVRQGLAGFLYLEILDASFSFDGVIAAFALSRNLFIIALGLGIGAAFVRSITIMLVEQKTLAAYRYLEHGAFWAIGSLAALMLASVHYNVPEVVTELVGAVLIGAALLSSITKQGKRDV